MTHENARRILVVDDEIAIVTVFADFLRRRGYAVRGAISGDAALRAVREERPHLVLLDINMPDSNGLHVLEEIQRVDRSIAVIMVTGNMDDRVCQDAIRRGAYSWLSKPVDLAMLDRFVDLALGRRQYVS